MKKICVYELATGKPRWTVDVPEAMAEAQTAGHDDLDQVEVSDTVNGRTHYILNGVVTARPAMAFGKLAIAADDADEARLVLDRPFAAEIDGQVFQVSDPDEAGDYVLALTSPMPAAYRVRVMEWPYQDYETMVVAS
jgi:hypothetical protein